jgi:hypothetical protein
VIKQNIAAVKLEICTEVGIVSHGSGYSSYSYVSVDKFRDITSVML